MVYNKLFVIWKKHFKPFFFILKALKDILQHFKFVNWRIAGFIFFMSRTGYMFLSIEGSPIDFVGETDGVMPSIHRCFPKATSCF